MKWLALLLLTGCAVVPRGPIVRHSSPTHVVERFACRPDGLVYRETWAGERWTDDAFGRGLYFFTDPKLSGLVATHTNQAALGGGSSISSGSISIIVDSNLVPAITATGTAAGNIIGAAAKTAVKP